MIDVEHYNLFYSKPYGILKIKCRKNNHINWVNFDLRITTCFDLNAGISNTKKSDDR